jgi:hypothetical protein
VSKEREVGHRWAVLGLHRKPIGLLNVEGYFDPLLTLLGHAVAERFVRPEHLAMIVVTDKPEALAADLLGHKPPALASGPDGSTRGRPDPAPLGLRAERRGVAGPGTTGMWRNPVSSWRAGLGRPAVVWKPGFRGDRRTPVRVQGVFDRAEQSKPTGGSENH